MHQAKVMRRSLLSSLFSFDIKMMIFILVQILSSTLVQHKCQCQQQSSLSDLLISHIISCTAADVQQQPTPMPNLVELDLDKVRALQQWLGQIVGQFVIEDGILAEKFKCRRQGEEEIMSKIGDIQLPTNDTILSNLDPQKRRQFIKLLFSFGALLSAEIGGPDLVQSSGSCSNHLRSLLMAYECVGGQLTSNEKIYDNIKATPSTSGKKFWTKFRKNEKNEKSSKFNFTQWTDPDHSIPAFAIMPFVTAGGGENLINKWEDEKRVYIEKTNSEHQRNIDKFALLKTLSTIKISPIDVMQLANLFYDTENPFHNEFLEANGLTIANFDTDKVIPRQVGRHLLLHLLNWGPNELVDHAQLKWFKDIPARVECAMSIFAKNLLQRVVNGELLNNYLGQIGMAYQIEGIRRLNTTFAHVVNNRCKQMVQQQMEQQLQQQQEEQRQNRGTMMMMSRPQIAINVYGHYAKAIRIDWNAYNEIGRQITVVLSTIERIKGKQKQWLKKYLKSADFERSMGIISAKFEAATTLKERVMKNNNTSNVEEFCNKLAIIDGGNFHIEKRLYDWEIPFKINLYHKKRAFYAQAFDLIAIIVHNFGAKWLIRKDDGREKIVFDYEAADKMLSELNRLAINEMLKKDNGDGGAKNKKCQTSTAAEMEKTSFQMAIMKIMRNERLKKLLDSINQQQFVKIPTANGSEIQKAIERKMASEIDAQLLHLVFSFAARLEALVQARNGDGTLGQLGPNAKDRMQTFLTVPTCFPVREWANEFGTFDCFIEASCTKCFDGSQKCKINVHKNLMKNGEKNDDDSSKRTSNATYELLKSLHAQPFSIYETAKLLKKINQQIAHFYRVAYAIEEKMPQIFEKLVHQIRLDIIMQSNAAQNNSNFHYYNVLRIKNFGNEQRLFVCENLRLQQYIKAMLVEMYEENGLKMAPSYENWVSIGRLQRQIEEECDKFTKNNDSDDGDALVVNYQKIRLANVVRYELAMRFEFNAWKDIVARMEDFSVYWANIVSGESIFDDLNKMDTIQEHFGEVITEIDALVKGFPVQFVLKAVNEEIYRQKVEMIKEKSDKKRRIDKWGRELRQQKGDQTEAFMNRLIEQILAQKSEIVQRKKVGHDGSSGSSTKMPIESASGGTEEGTSEKRHW